MSRPCCGLDHLDPNHSYCVNMADSDAEEGQCESEFAGVLGPPGTCCADPAFENPICTTGVPGEEWERCWLCASAFTPPIGVPRQQASCCFNDLSGGNSWLPAVWIRQCLGSCRGIPGISEEECLAEPPREQECIEAGEDRPPYEGAPLWTLNTAGTVVFGLAKVTGDFPEDWPEGYTYGLSTHLTRPREPDVPVNACGHAVGRLTMLDDGDVYMETCSLPDVNNHDSHRRSYGVLWTAPETDSRIGVEAGYQYWVTCIRLPAWTEVLYRSHQSRCRHEIV